jgi:hypothetical protein
MNCPGTVCCNTVCVHVGQCDLGESRTGGGGWCRCRCVQRKERMWQPHRPQAKWWAKNWSVNTDYRYSVHYKLILTLVMLADAEPPGVTDCTSNDVTAASAFEDGWVQVAKSLFPYFGDRAQTSYMCVCVRVRGGISRQMLMSLMSMSGHFLLTAIWRYQRVSQLHLASVMISQCMNANSNVLIGWILCLEHWLLQHTVAGCSNMSIVLHSLWLSASVSRSHRSPSTGLIH